jgi:hypothetical protein
MILSPREFVIQLIVLIEEPLDDLSFVSEVHTEDFSLSCEGLHILGNIIAIERELSQVLILQGENLVCLLQLLDSLLEYLHVFQISL